MRITRQPDIGKCDDCGDTESKHHKMLRDVTVQGEEQRIEVYVCGPCRGKAWAEGNFVGGR